MGTEVNASDPSLGDDGSWTPATPRRVLIVTVLPETSALGVQTHIRQVAEVLRAAGCSVEIIRPASRFPRLSFLVLAPTRVLRRLGSERLVRLDRAAHAGLLEHAVGRKLQTPAVVYAQDPRAANASLRARGGAAARVVMVVHYNESQAQELVERELIAAGGRADRAIRAFEGAVLPQLDGLVFVSDFMRERVQDAVPAASAVPSVVVPNFLTSLPPPSSREVIRDCITVGSLVERKNHRYLLHVLAAAARAGHHPTLTVVGDGPERDTLEQLAEDLGVGPQVWFTGKRRDVDDLLLQHRLYVHGATIENAPFAIIEALRAGLPFIAAPVGGVPEIAGDTQAGRFWDLDDPVGGSRVLTALLENSGELDESSRQARDRFAAHFSERAADALVAFLLQSTDSTG